MPSPLALSLISPKDDEQFDKEKHISIKIINFLIIIFFYSISILAAQYLNSGILPKGSKAGLVNRLAAASL